MRHPVLTFFKDIIIESSIIGQSSVRGVLSGTFYNGSTRCHKVLHEALKRICFQVFMEILSPDEQKSIEEHIAILSEHCPQENQFLDMLESPDFQ